jgi:hypothetical protein
VTPDTIFLSILTLIAAGVVLYLVWSNRHHREHRDLKRAIKVIPTDLGRAIAASESLMGRIETRLIEFERAEASRYKQLLHTLDLMQQTIPRQRP